jgi:hypothetical protein
MFLYNGIYSYYCIVYQMFILRVNGRHKTTYKNNTNKIQIFTKKNIYCFLL